MRASEFMSHPPITIDQNATAEQAAQLMIINKIDCLPVIDTSGELRGIVTPSDYATREVGIPFSIIRAPQVFGRWLPPGGIEAIYRSARETPVHAIMTRTPVTCGQTDSLDEVASLLVDKKVHHVIVVHNHRPVGVVARHDLLRALTHATGLMKVP